MLMIVSALLFAIQVHAKSIVWKQGPPTMPKGARIAVLEGDPSKSGIFTLRIKFPAGAIVGPHWHPRPERVTLLSGRVMVGFGDVVDTSKTKTFHAGDFYVNPPDVHHFVVVPVETVVQVTGEGPWETHLLE
ncbi:MAG TPA: cupin domain-containing protein [Thermoanaerobaculia bacterium]|nr:cupin domain-containing protein [Thermoanaerobaculia bacterium]